MNLLVDYLIWVVSNKSLIFDVDIVFIRKGNHATLIKMDVAKMAAPPYDTGTDPSLAPSLSVLLLSIIMLIIIITRMYGELWWRKQVAGVGGNAWGCW